jgi:hypothetical protein
MNKATASLRLWLLKEKKNVSLYSSEADRLLSDVKRSLLLVDSLKLDSCEKSIYI